MDRAPRLLRLLVALAPLVLTLLAAPAHATGEDASEHRRATPTPTQPTVEAYAVPVSRRVTYSVTTRGRVTTSMKVFRRQAQQTFDDPRGWRAAGVQFRRVRRGGDFTLVLAAAGTLPSFSSGCSVQWSCRVGRHVVINQLRWSHGLAGLEPRRTVVARLPAPGRQPRDRPLAGAWARLVPRGAAGRR